MAVLTTAAAWGGCAPSDAPGDGASAEDAAASVGQATAMFRGDAAHSGVYAGSVDAFRGVRWRFDAEGAVRASPTVADGIVYVGSTGGGFFALRVADGGQLWRFETGSSVSSSAAVAGGAVFFGDRDNTLRALDAATGQGLWTFPTGADRPLDWGGEGWDYFTSSPTVAEGTVLFGSGDGHLYAVDAATGTERWRYATEGRIRSSPAVHDGVVYVGSMDGSLHAVELDSGAARWRHDTEGHGLDSGEWGFDRKSIQSSPAVADGRVVFGGRDGFMYAVDAGTGDLLWRFDHEVSWCIVAPAVHDGVVFGGSSDGLFAHAVDAASGEELWRVNTEARVFASPAVAGETVLVADHEGVLRALEASTGRERWRFRAGADFQSSPVVADDAVFVGNDDGHVYAIESGAGPSVERVVLWDEGLPSLVAGHETLRDHLASSGYDVVDASALPGLLAARVEDGAPSTIVFVQGWIPSTVAAEPSDTVLLRRYLEAGGRAVWVGYPPLSLIFDADAGAITGVDMTRSEALLGIDHDEVSGDEYATFPTADGRSWGLGEWGVDIFGVEASEVTTVLALSERGRATSWVRRYGADSAGAFIRVGGILPETGGPALVRRVADHAMR